MQAKSGRLVLKLKNYDLRDKKGIYYNIEKLISRTPINSTLTIEIKVTFISAKWSQLAKFQKVKKGF